MDPAASERDDIRLPPYMPSFGKSKNRPENRTVFCGFESNLESGLNRIDQPFTAGIGWNIIVIGRLLPEAIM